MQIIKKKSSFLKINSSRENPAVRSDELFNAQGKHFSNNYVLKSKGIFFKQP
jgi:hypothetical protein